MQGDECSGDPVSTCKVPQQEIVHGGFGLKGQGFVVCTSCSSQTVHLLRRSLSILALHSAGSLITCVYMFVTTEWETALF